ncbi:ABC transporter ATP-binding protein (plasmid) [Shinella sumterensis]|nr:ABC transporter ATP-binding protein [Shinella sumterensis]
MSSNIALKAAGLGKAFQIYRKPQDRLKQMVFRWNRYYEEYWAVQNVDLTVHRGETVGIVGRNGSGKSTLLQLIAGTLQPSVGTLSVYGRVAPLLELGAGFNPEFTGRENVKLAGTIMGVAPDYINKRFDEILDFAGIGEFIEQPVKTYSSGMYARLAFAVAAHVEPDILIVDETLSVGDAAFGQKCMRYIRQFKKDGTLLFVSHDTAAVTALCDRVLWLDNGMIRAEGATKDVTFAYHAALREEIDGGGFSVAGRRRHHPVQPSRDLRHEKIRKSDKRNVIEVFEFDPDAPSFGKKGGTIDYVRIKTAGGGHLAEPEGGESVTVEIVCTAQAELTNPIIGFLLRDKLAQNIFGDNTYLSYAEDHVSVAAGQQFKASFTFQMPYLPPGDYSIAAALAEGSQTDHVQHHWIDEALIFRIAAGHVTHGVLGIPMNEITLEVLTKEDME